MITILETHTNDDDNEVWFKVALERNADVLAKVLYTEDDIEVIKRKAIKEFLDKLVDKLMDDV